MSIYYLIALFGMFGLGYRVGTAYERIRLNLRLRRAFGRGL